MGNIDELSIACDAWIVIHCKKDKWKTSGVMSTGIVTKVEKKSSSVHSSTCIWKPFGIYQIRSERCDAIWSEMNQMHVYGILEREEDEKIKHGFMILLHTFMYFEFFLFTFLYLIIFFIPRYSHITLYYMKRWVVQCWGTFLHM